MGEISAATRQTSSSSSANVENFVHNYATNIAHHISIPRIKTPAMAPVNELSNTSITLQAPSLLPFYHQYSSPMLSISASDPKSSFDNPLSPRSLYAQAFDHTRAFTFDRPYSAQTLPSARRFRKNMKNIIGFGTTDEEFEALPIAVRRKVRPPSTCYIITSQALWAVMSYFPRGMCCVFAN